MTDTSNPGPNQAGSTTANPYGKARQKVPPFARYVGTSAWRKDRRRAHAYALFRAAAKQAGQDQGVLGS